MGEWNCGTKGCIPQQSLELNKQKWCIANEISFSFIFLSSQKHRKNC